MKVEIKEYLQSEIDKLEGLQRDGYTDEDLDSYLDFARALMLQYINNRK
tara:strand:+ start:115 stop:261 length:147 start_codon:yes stop_codon:yes gene_type:complete